MDNGKNLVLRKDLTQRLLEKGYDVTIVDNLVNSKALVVDRIENLSGKKVKFLFTLNSAITFKRLKVEMRLFS